MPESSPNRHAMTLIVPNIGARFSKATYAEHCHRRRAGQPEPRGRNGARSHYELSKNNGWYVLATSSQARGRGVRETSCSTPWPQWGQHSESSSGIATDAGSPEVSQRQVVHAEQLPAQGQLLVADAVGQEAKAADADESTGKHMHHKPPQELLRREGHPPLAVAVRVVLITERDLTILQGLDPLVADRHAIRVPCQVLERLFHSAE